MNQRSWSGLLLMISLLILPGIASAEIVCEAKTSCVTGEAHLIDMSAETNAHAALPGQSSYQYALCCSGHGVSADTSGDFDQDILRLSSATNAHACAGCSYSNTIDFSIDDPTVLGLSCSYSSTGCSSGDSCIIGLSGDSNAHVASCGSKPVSYGAICCQMILDGDPPLVSDDYANDGQWVDSGQTIGITASDSGSGMDEIRYAWAYSDCGVADCSSIDQDDACITACPEPTSCDVSAPENTNENLCYYGIDVAQNPSGWGSTNVKVDLTQPHTNCQNCPENDSIVGQDFIVTLSATDQDSGIDRESGIDRSYLCYYRSQGGSCSFQEYTSPVQVGSDCPSEGVCEYIIEYYSVDVAGNEELPHHKRTITVDRNLPTCEFSQSLPGILNTQTVYLEWAANDPVSGSSFIKYDLTAKTSTDGGQTYTNTVGSHTISTESQTTYDFPLSQDDTYQFWCEVTYDRGGSTVTSYPGLYTVTVDTTPPVVTLSGGSLEYSDQETFSVSWSVDDINNVDHYELEINGSVADDSIPASQTSTDYTGEQGKGYEISLVAYDIADNPSSPAEKTVVVDTQAPSCSMGSLAAYTNKTTFTLTWSGSDDGSGVDDYDICINSSGPECTSPTQGWSGLSVTTRPFTGANGNTYHFRCRATDVAGNLGAWSLAESTTIDSTPPVITGDAPGYPGSVTSSSYDDMFINATITDNIGIQDVVLRMGDDEISPEEVTGETGDTEWLIVWEIPYNTYITETGFSITMSDVNENSDSKDFDYSVFECNQEEERECNPRDPSTGDAYTQGVCKGTGTRKCGSDGFWGNCTGGTLPTEEDCNELDDDCDGEVDEDLDSEPCGPSTDMGICRYGSRSCVDGSWGSCSGAVFPLSREDCENSLDDDCDGTVNNDCECFTDGETKPCGESNVGACMLGTSTCTDGRWGNCVGSVNPITELCDDGIDNDCDGETDEGCQTTTTGGDEPSGGFPFIPGLGENEGFPWWMLSLVGVIILVVHGLLWYYFKRQGEELTWETLKKKWTPTSWRK